MPAFAQTDKTAIKAYQGTEPDRWKYPADL